MEFIAILYCPALQVCLDEDIHLLFYRFGTTPLQMGIPVHRDR